MAFSIVTSSIRNATTRSILTTTSLRNFCRNPSHLSHLTKSPVVSARTPLSLFHSQSLSSRLTLATHRSGIYSVRTPFTRSSRSSWNSQPPSSRGPLRSFRESFDRIPNGVIFWGILVLNGGVFLAWQFARSKYRDDRDPAYYIWMHQNFTVSWQNVKNGRLWTILTSSMSHENTSHLLFNGFTYFFIAPAVLSMLGNASFLALYFGGGIVSSLASLMWKQTFHHPNAHGSHGASGAVYSVISFFACVAPTTTFYIFAILPMPAWAFVTGIFLWDGYDTITNKQSTTDTAGHVGGLLAGMGYFVLKRFRIM